MQIEIPDGAWKSRVKQSEKTIMIMKKYIDKLEDELRNSYFSFGFNESQVEEYIFNLRTDASYEGWIERPDSLAVIETVKVIRKYFGDIEIKPSITRNDEFSLRIQAGPTVEEAIALLDKVDEELWKMRDVVGHILILLDFK